MKYLVREGNSTKNETYISWETLGVSWYTPAAPKHEMFWDIQGTLLGLLSVEGKYGRVYRFNIIVSVALQRNLQMIDQTLYQST